MTPAELLAAAESRLRRAHAEEETTWQALRDAASDEDRVLTLREHSSMLSRWADACAVHAKARLSLRDQRIIFRASADDALSNLRMLEQGMQLTSRRVSRLQQEVADFKVMLAVRQRQLREWRSLPEALYHLKSIPLVQ